MAIIGIGRIDTQLMLAKALHKTSEEVLQTLVESTKGDPAAIKALAHAMVQLNKED